MQSDLFSVVPITKRLPSASLPTPADFAKAQIHLWKFCRSITASATGNANNNNNSEATRKLFESILGRMYLNKFNSDFFGNCNHFDNNDITSKGGYNLSSRFFSDFVDIEKLYSGTSQSATEVYCAKSLVDQNYYAIKRINLSAKTNFAKRAKNLPIEEIIEQIQKISALCHKNVVRYFTSWVEFEVKIDKIETQTEQVRADMIINQQFELLEEANFLNQIRAIHHKKDKLKVANDIACGLEFLHSANIPHGNLSAKTVLSDFEGNFKLVGIEGCEKGQEEVTMKEDIFNFGLLLKKLFIECSNEKYILQNEEGEEEFNYHNDQNSEEDDNNDDDNNEEEENNNSGIDEALSELIEKMTDYNSDLRPTIKEIADNIREEFENC